MTKSSTLRPDGGSALRLPKSKGLVILIACGAGLAVFAGIAVISTVQVNARLSSQADMLAAVPNTLMEGTTSGLFTGRAAPDDVTAFHPAYLMGALSAVLDSGNQCNDPAHIVARLSGAYCALPGGGTIAVESNMMPQLVHSVAGNSFDPQGTPLGSDGRSLERPENIGVYGKTSIATIRYSEMTRDQPRISERIVNTLIGQHLTSMTMNGSWLPARPGMGFRTCFAGKESTGVFVTCYRG